MSKFFEDVGNVVSAPFKSVYGLVTNNPKYNSLEDQYNQSFGDSNPVADVFQNEGLNKAARIFSAPSWDALGKPGEAFANFIDTQNSILPADWRPYAQPVESALLNFVPGVGPLLSAGYNTAYQGGKQQELNKGFDWGELGKNAAINFGTAAATLGANKLLSNADRASSLKAFQATPDSATGSFNAGNNLNTILGNVGTSSATPGLAANTAGNLAADSASALSSIGAAIPETASAGSSALSAFNTPFNSSNQSLVPRAQAAQSSGIGDAFYKNAVHDFPGVANRTLAATLAPEGSQPISGTALDSFGASPDAAATQPSYQFGDILNAFGGSEGTNPNSSGVRIDSNALDQIGQRLSANNYLQTNQARDTALPAGQYKPVENTPYSNRLTEINKGTDQAFSDLLNEVGNYNKYYSVIDNNPGVTTDQLDAYLNDPTSGLIGNFSVPQEQTNFFQGLRPLTSQNTPLLH